MEKKDRNILKSYFRKGSIPSEQHFADLIDSVPNIAEDGQFKRTDGGWALYPSKGRPLQLTLHDSEGQPAAWTLTLKKDKGLEIKNETGKTVLSMGQGGMNLPKEDEPEEKTENDVRKAVEETVVDKKADYLMSLPADGIWHDIVIVASDTQEFHAYQVFACITGQDAGSFKGMHAVAYNFGHQGYDIESPDKHWFGWMGGMAMRWNMRDGKLWLQIRSLKNCEPEKIHCIIR